MDEHELEARLRARLHARYDAGVAPDRLRRSVHQALATERAGTRHVPLSLPRWAGQLLAAAAVVVLVAVAALAVRYSALPGTGGSPSPTPAASATPTPASSSSAPSPTVPPISTSSWTSLRVEQLAVAPTGVATLVPWSAGYVAVSQPASGAQVAWSSRDGRSWTRLPAATFGLDDPTGNTMVFAGTACRQGVLVMTEDGTGAGTVWSSRDGSTWSRGSLPGGGATFDLDGNASGAVAAIDSGVGAAAGSGTPRIAVTTDCDTWTQVTLPGPSQATVTGLAAFGSGFVAVGYSGRSGTGATQPLAWMSSDGRHWSSATVPARRGDGFESVCAAAGGLVAISDQPGLVPGSTTLWRSTDGRSWTTVASPPLGTLTQGEGGGSLAASFSGDGTRLLAQGTQNGQSGPGEYLISSDGVQWTRLSITGPAAATLQTDTPSQAFLMRDGLYFSGTNSSFFGTATP